MTVTQLILPFAPPTTEPQPIEDSCKEALLWALSQDLGFHDEDSSYASHTFHSFPAKFPPQLPRLFIQTLTRAGDVVLDPMAGSGTTVVEAFLAGRQAIGFDIDPLALLLTQVKVTPIDYDETKRIGHHVIGEASRAAKENAVQLMEFFGSQRDDKTREFIDYWFARETQVELMALLREIRTVADDATRSFLLLAFSSIIITKSGGVSLARDLGHTRPHRAKVIYAPSGALLEGKSFVETGTPNLQHHTKLLRSPVEEFAKRLRKNLEGIRELKSGLNRSQVQSGNAQAMPLADETVDLIVTSPPYASNAIDYMRAHKFSLVWLGYPVEELGQRRRDYIGGEAIAEAQFEQLPPYAEALVRQINQLDARKGQVIRRYYSEMTRTFREMYRVLKGGRAAIIVVGTSVVRNKDIEVGECLTDIARSLGFEVPQISVRGLDRDRRMMPAGNHVNRESQIQQRMHEEYVLGLWKPE